MSTLLHGLEGTDDIMDDILIYGKTHKEHNTRLKKTLNRILETGIKLNRDKSNVNLSVLKLHTSDTLLVK